MADVRGNVHDPITRTVVECAADAIVAFDADHRVTLWNPAAERMFGWRAADVVGKDAPIVPEELRAEHNAVLERIKDGGQISTVTRRLHREGHLVDVRIDTAPLHGVPGWVSVFHPVAEDEAVQHHVAERVRLVRRLNDVVKDINAERDLPTVLDRITVALIELTGADAAGFVRIEGERLRLMSLSGLPESLRGRTADLRTSLVGELLRSEKTVMLARDEHLLDELIWAELPGLHSIALGMSYLAEGPYGALYALFSGGREVTHTELELLELLAGHAGVAVSNAEAYTQVVRQRAYERAVIDASADGIAVLDAHGIVRRWNPSAYALTGVPPEEAIGRPLPFEQPEPGEMSTFLHAGRIWLNVLCAEIEGTDELVVDFRDVTKAKELEEAKDLFLATTSHELRTPITVVHGFASTLADRWEKLGDADRRSAVTSIADRAAALRHLVEQLLIGSRAGAGSLKVTIEPFDLEELLVGAVAGFSSLSDRHTVELVVEPGLPPVRGDAMATDIIVGQLLENAIKYSPDGGRILVRAVGEDRRTVVTVDDEGIGIPAADRERIFERFTQGEAGDRRRFGGVGLGLYIVKQLAVAQGGDVSAHPAAGGVSGPGRTGRGTCMRLVLPQMH
jgi:PAS domain S-box-containing protein